MLASLLKGGRGDGVAPRWGSVEIEREMGVEAPRRVVDGRESVGDACFFV